MTRSGVFLSIFVLLSSICFSTASRAEGFFEMLFGGGRQHADSQANYVVAPPQARLHASHRHHVAVRHKRMTHFAMRAHARHHRLLARHIKGPAASGGQLSYAAIPASTGAPVDGQKCCADAQDAIAKIMHEDPTLRPGDAYMSADGLRVYEGDRAKDQEFVPLRQAHALDKTSKARLAAVEKAPVQAILNPSSKLRLAPASAPRAGIAPDQRPAKLNKESFIKTFSGKTIRFVGGYAG